MVFDTYDRKARLLPALLLLVGPALAVAVLVDPWGVGVGVAGIVEIGLGVPLAHLVRHAGRSLQKRLWAEWGGPPLATTLAGDGPDVDDLIRRRAIARLRLLFPDANVPADGRSSDYAGVASLIPDRVRKEPGGEIVAAENRQYGFERNLFAVRPAGIIISALVTGVLVASAATGGGIGSVYAAVGATVWTGAWVLYPSEQRIREAAEIYSIAAVTTLAAEAVDTKR